MAGNEVNPSTDGVDEAIENLAEENEIVEEEIVEEEIVEEEEEEVVENGVTIDSLLQELVGNEYELSDELKAKAEDAGINVDSLELAGIKDQRRAGEVIKGVYEQVGGEAEFKAMQKWATEGGLSEDEAKEFNAGITGENRGMFVKGLHAMYKASNHEAKSEEEKVEVKETKRVKGKAPQANSIHKGYKSLQEMQKDISYMRRNPSDSDAQRTYNEKMKHSGGLLKR